MSRYPIEPLDFTGLRTVPLAARGGKVRVEQFVRPWTKGGNIASFIDSLPAVLAAESLRHIVTALQRARSRRRPILWGLGGHVIKCGLAPALADLMDRGFATAFVLNGATAIHDFEIAIAGHTSEDVESVLPDGRFGIAEETGREINGAILNAARQGMGIGEALGERLQQLARSDFAANSLLWRAWRREVPVTVHVAIGTDTPHIHPLCDGSALGAGSHRDFRLLCSLVRELNDGGVYINAGSAVVLPEVFLKAVSVVRNLGNPLRDFVTVNFDFLEHYRPRVNVLGRPHADAGGAAYQITGHHELTIPLVAAALVEGDE